MLSANDRRDTHSRDWLEQDKPDTWGDYALLAALGIALWLIAYRFLELI